MTQMLVVGDTPEVQAAVAVLKTAGYSTGTAPGVADAVHALLISDMAVVVLFDDAQPIMGEDSVALIRRFTDAALLVVGPPGEDRLVRALLEGADTYIPQPLDKQELLARVYSLTRRDHSGLPGLGQRVSAQLGILIRELESSSQRSCGGESVDPNSGGTAMTAVESKLLHYLLDHPGVTVPPGELANAVWGRRGSPSLLRYYVKRLRDKLRGLATVRITTVRGQGYRLNLSGPATPATA